MHNPFTRDFTDRGYMILIIGYLVIFIFNILFIGRIVHGFWNYCLISLPFYLGWLLFALSLPAPITKEKKY